MNKKGGMKEKPGPEGFHQNEVGLL